MVAGQLVRLLPGVDASAAAERAWVAVGGFRSVAGEILASRIDSQARGDVVVTAQLSPVAEGWQVGSLAVEGRGLAAFAGERIRVRGRLRDGRLYPVHVSRAPRLPLLPGVDHIVMQTLVTGEGAVLRLGDGLEARRGMAFGSVRGDAPVILKLVANPDGSLTATGVLSGNAADGGSLGTPSAVPPTTTTSTVGQPSTPHGGSSGSVSGSGNSGGAAGSGSSSSSGGGHGGSGSGGNSGNAGNDNGSGGGGKAAAGAASGTAGAAAGVAPAMVAAAVAEVAVAVGADTAAAAVVAAAAAGAVTQAADRPELDKL